MSSPLLRHRIPVVALVTLGALLSAWGPPAAADSEGQRPPMLTGVAPGVDVHPIISVGDRLGGYEFDAIPDGIAIDPSSTEDSLEIYVNHETSTVPFPYVLPEPTIENSRNDFHNSRLSHLSLGPDARVRDAEIVIRSSANYQRFCSNFLAGPEEGFDRPLLFTNEEATDFVNRTGRAWPPGPEAEQAGVVVAFDPATGEYRSIYGMGRMNHENSVAIPGYSKAIVLTTDDTFSAPSSQLYMYFADDADGVWNDKGHLMAFRSDVPEINDYGDLAEGMSVSGRFIRVPNRIARGEQTPLEEWSNENNVFQFIRLEDLAYDRNQPNVIYVADTGEPRAIPDPSTGRLMRGPSGTMGPYPNGRIFRFELDPNDPESVIGLSILVNADPGGYSNPSVLHQPDNVETTPNSLLIQEDPGTHNQYTPDDPNGITARIWRYDLGSGSMSVVAKVDQSADPEALLGAWESSGIVDASRFFGKGAFLVDVQAHTLFLETAPGPDMLPPEGPDWLYKQEGGQLLLIRIPGA